MIIRKTTKEILVESFRQLAERKKINKITIKDITDNCGLSPATFYRHYKDKYDLIAWDYAKRVREIMQRSSEESRTWKQVLLIFTEVYYEQKDFFVNVLCHTGGYDSFVRHMTEVSIAEIEEFIKRKNGGKELQEETMLYIRFYTLGAEQLICEWLLGKIEAGPEKMAEILEKAVPSSLAGYFD